jgi:nucleoside-diphosphate-sugar epimerase
MKVLMTGGSGLVGRTLAPLLAGEHDVAHFDAADPADGHPFIRGDLRDRAAVEAACAGRDVILHIAALHGAAWRQAGDDAGFDVNVNGTRNILEAAVKQGVRRVVFTSSIWATGHGADTPYRPIDEDLPREPAELYGLTKKLGEAMCRYYAARSPLSVIVLRPGGIRPPEMHRPGDAAYLFGAVDVRDVADAHRLALEAPASMKMEVFIVTADSPLRKITAEDYRRDPAGALAGQVPGAGDAVRAGRLKLDPAAEWYSIARAERLLGYHPTRNFFLHREA